MGGHQPRPATLLAMQGCPKLLAFLFFNFFNKLRHEDILPYGPGNPWKFRPDQYDYNGDNKLWITGNILNCHPVDCWRRYLIQVFPEPGTDASATLGPEELPRNPFLWHQSIPDFFCSECKGCCRRCACKYILAMPYNVEYKTHRAEVLLSRPLTKPSLDEIRWRV